MPNLASRVATSQLKEPRVMPDLARVTRIFNYSNNFGVEYLHCYREDGNFSNSTSLISQNTMRKPSNPGLANASSRVVVCSQENTKVLKGLGFFLQCVRLQPSLINQLLNPLKSQGSQQCSSSGELVCSCHFRRM